MSNGKKADVVETAAAENTDPTPATAAVEEWKPGEGDRKLKYVGKIKSLIREGEKAGEYEEVRRKASQVPDVYHIGGSRIEMPPGREQLEGFYHKDWRVLLRVFPEDFKIFVNKGGEDGKPE